MPKMHMKGAGSANQERWHSLPEIVSTVESDDVLCFNSAASFPMAFAEALVDQNERLENVSIVHAMRRAPWDLKVDYLDDNLDGTFFHISDFTFDDEVRHAFINGRATYRPNHPHQAADGLSSIFDGYTFVSSASPPDRHGYMSLGAFGGWGIPFARTQSTDRIILEVNPNQPRLLGDVSVHISDVDALYEVDYELRSDSLTGLDPTDVDKRIAENVAGLIDDGSTLQIGAGVIPDQIVKLLVEAEKKHLGIHSEAIFDSVVELIESGVVDNSRKSIHKGKSVVALSLGSERLYRFLDDNPAVEMHPCTYVNDPEVIAKNSKQIAINATVQVDLMGQCSSESIGARHYSGTGGQWEFIYGAGHSEDGKAIIVLSSTARDGELSSIVPQLPQGTPITVPRNDVDYVVTEHGVASLRGRTLVQRAKELISIAHPKFREQILSDAKGLNIV